MFSSTSRRSISYKERQAISTRRVRRIVMLVVLFTVYLFFSNKISTAVRVQSSSMAPTLSTGDRVLYSPLLTDSQKSFFNLTVSNIERGDLVVITPPYFRENQSLIDFINPVVRFFTFQKFQFSSYSRQDWESNLLIKRVVALPGDTLRMYGYQLYVKKEGENIFQPESLAISSDYSFILPRLPEGWSRGYPFDGSLDEYTLADNEYFLLSDSRGEGSDSYMWGPISKEKIRGKVFFRYWPLRGMSFL